MSKKIYHFRGNVLLHSSLSLEEVANILSKKVLGGIRFWGKESKAYNEFPVVFTKKPFLGFTFFLQEAEDRGEFKVYILSLTHELYATISPYLEDYTAEGILLNDYFYVVLKAQLKKIPQIIVEESCSK